MHLSDQQSQLSVKPPSQFSNISLEAVDSTLGLVANIPYRTIQHAAEQASDEPQIGSGERQTCKRILGANVCATTVWQYQVKRSGQVTLTKNNDSVRVSIPLSLTGKVGVDGRSAKLLGLQNKDITGELQLIADIRIGIKSNWCPAIESKLEYRWLSDPRIQLAGKIKINMRKSADKALNKKLNKLEQKFSSLIDCKKFRQQVATSWKIHYLPIKIPGQNQAPHQAPGQAFLELIPKSAAVSNVVAHSDHVSVALEMFATTEIVQQQSLTTSLVLPDLLPKVTNPGAVEFSLLINLPYSQIKELVSKKVLGDVQSTDGKNFQILSFDLYPSGNRLIFDLEFVTTGFKTFLKTTGHLYLSARPVADPDSNELRFEDLQFTRIIDSDLWSLFSTVLHQRILDSLHEAAIIDMAPQMAKLERSIVKTLSDPEKTAGIVVNASPPEVRLVTVNPEADSLAAIIHVSTRLHATIPPNSLLRD